MIVTIYDDVFAPDTADDVLLTWILRQGMNGRFGVHTRPVFRHGESRHVNRWLERLSDSARETARLGLRRGLGWLSREWPRGRREPEVMVEVGARTEWPRSFDEAEARFALGEELEAFLARSLRLKLENEVADWYFLQRVVPPEWRARWQRATKRGWLEPEQGGGITEIRRVLEQEVVHDDRRRLRMWVMFDSDRDEPGMFAAVHAEDITRVCQHLGVPHHMLARRMIENYVPESALRAWAAAVQQRVTQESNRNKDRAGAEHLLREVDAYWDMAPEERCCADLKKIAKIAKKFGMGTVADIWRESSYPIHEVDLLNDGWDDERHALFESLFASL